MNELKVKALSKKYKDKYALKDCSFEVKSGEILGIIGKNGAGKTSLFNLIAGNTLASSGKIFFNQEELGRHSLVRKDFGVLIRPVLYDWMTGYDFLKRIDRLNTRIHTGSEIIRTLDMVGLGPAKDKWIKSYSFGMKQRLCFAQALLGANKFLLLDEPFVGLDIKGRDLVKRHIRDLAQSKNIPIIFSDHNLDEVKDLCTRIVLLNTGQVVYDGNLKTFQQDITISVEDSREIDRSLARVINDHQVVVKQADLDASLRMILSHTKINSMENKNVLDRLLNGGAEDE